MEISEPKPLTGINENQRPLDHWDVYWKYFWAMLDPLPRPESWQVVPGCMGISKILREYGCKTILEAASGIGLKAITFQRLGFDVTGMDISPTGVDLARKLSGAARIPVTFHRLSWQEAPSMFADQFDAVVMDQLSNVCTMDEMLEAARCAYSALHSGGIFVFAGREKTEWEMSPSELLEYRWEKTKRYRVGWSKDTSTSRMTTLTVCEQHSDGIYHHFLHLTEENGKRSLETSGFLDGTKWIWQDFVEVLSKAGFGQIIRKPTEGTKWVSGIAIKPVTVKDNET